MQGEIEHDASILQQMKFAAVVARSGWVFEICVMVQIVAQLSALVGLKGVSSDAEMRGNADVSIPCFVWSHAESEGFKETLDFETVASVEM